MRSARLKNSMRASIATTAAHAASSSGGPHQTSARTAGIRTAEVEMRSSIRRSASHRRSGGGARPRRLPLALGRRCTGVLGPEAAVAAFARLIVEQGVEEPGARKVRPKNVRHIDFSIRNLPEQKIADAHFAAGANQEIGIGQTRGVQVIGDGL